MKLLFLDIDGVLNCLSDFIAANLLKLPRHKDDKGSTIIDPVKIYYLNQIIEQTDAKIVISSTWRHSYSVDELYALFKDRGATFSRDTIIGTTECIQRLTPRAFRIQDYLDSHRANGHRLTSFCILDDDFSAGNGYQEWNPNRYGATEEGDTFVRTEWHVGLTVHHMKAAIDILGRNPKYQKEYDDYQKGLEMFSRCTI